MNNNNIMAAIKREVVIYDRRTGDTPERVFDISSDHDFASFRQHLRKFFSISQHEKFVICTTNREEINEKTYLLLEHMDTLYILRHLDQDLLAQTQERVEYLPHYDTLIKSGMYEYYASEGQNPLPYAFAELIDNALAATVNNTGSRKIELRLMLDDISSDKSIIYVIDNGCGMSSWQLQNWAVYRLSKFIRKDRTFHPIDSPSSPHHKTHMPRSLNSEISYFGVGGKQAIFFIGHATRMITKPKNSKDVHELCISKEEFEKKERNKEFVYSGIIRNRKPGDSSHIAPEDEHTRRVIAEEAAKENFTCVAIWGISLDHIYYLKHNFRKWCTQLAHIYHYYIHGPNGNVGGDSDNRRVPSPFNNIDIEVKLCMKGCTTKVINLRDIDDDLQSQFIRTASSTFEFRATVDGTRVVEGILRYHPFLYDKETFPPDAADPRVIQEPEDDHDYFMSDTRPARGRRPIFECYWNGRLIPYTTIEEFEWCGTPKKTRNVPIECYNRVSGVLWTDDAFEVSTNKLTFMDLENRLRDKNTVFARVISGVEKRSHIDRQFTEWLQQCHEHCDKQVVFTGFQGIISRPELQKHKQFPWAVYNAIEWDGKIFKKGQMVRIHRTIPVLVGTVQRFLLYGDHEGDVCATGGDVEIQQEPRTLYDEVKVFPLAKLDRKATEKMMQKFIEEEEEKLPEKLLVSWPEGDALTPGEKRPAGKTIGAIKVEISNRRGECISRLPGSSTTKKLLIELKIVWHSPSGDVTVAQYVCAHAKTWPYWFRKMENITNLGAHTLSLQAMLSEGGTVLCSGKELPGYKLRFTVTEGPPEKFTVGILDGPFRVGSPFQIPLEFQDKYGNPTKPHSELCPILKASGIDLFYENTQIKGNNLIIKGIIAKGTVESSSGKNFTLSVKIPGLEDDTQSLKIRLLPGLPHTLVVNRDNPVPIEIENSTSPSFDVMTVDVAGNITCEPRLIAICKFISQSQSGLPTYTADLSSSGRNTLTGGVINLRSLQGNEVVKARIEIQNRKDIAPVEVNVTVLPSRKAASFVITYLNENKERVPIERDKDVTWVAGELLTGLEFQILDEGGRELTITPQLASKIKVNWTSKVPREVFASGCLPDIEAPQSVKQQTYCHVGLSDTKVVEFSFVVKPRHGEPSYLKATCSGSNKVRIGEVLQSDILVTVADKHGNPVKKLNFKNLAELLVIAEGLDYTHLVKALGQSSGFVISGIKFDDGQLGSREICIQWRNLKDYVRVEMIAGPPARLLYPGIDYEEVLTLYNESRLPHPLTVQLCDTEGNESNESNVKVQLGIDEGLKVMPASTIQKTNALGRAEFGVLSVSVRGNAPPGKCQLGLCTQNCRGVFSICARATVGRNVILGPLLKIHIPCDPGKASEIKVDYDRAATFCAGKELPDFTVSIIAEDGSIMKSVKPNQVVMKIWKSENYLTKCPAKALSYSAEVASKEANRKFIFRKKKVPQVAGSHCMQFFYEAGSNSLSSHVLPLNVIAGPPVKLVPTQDPGMPTVSNTAKSSSRYLIRHLKLELKDEYDNLAGVNQHGTLNVQIMGKGPANSELPRMVGNVTSIEVPITKGQATLLNLMMHENTPGVDGKEYILRCTASIPGVQIAPYDICFLFYNDAHKQAQMATLSKERDQLLSAIKTYRCLFETTQQLLKELETTVQDAAQEEARLKAELKAAGFPAQNLYTVNQVASAIEKCAQNKQKVEKMKRRECTLQPAPDEPDILGKIGHLAYVEDEQIARVLSWHMQADMDCVVAHTMTKARDLHWRTKGQQQVLPLDCIYKKNLPNWNTPLPHVKLRSFTPRGNPTYARDMLIFHKEPESCKIVFGMLLGDTIILDSLEDATAYREQLVKHTYCPTLLTRTGDRIRSNGKFGGHQNKAPPIERMRGAVFGEPVSKEKEQLEKQIELLQSLQQAIERHIQAKEELLEQQRQESSPDMMEKIREFQETEKQLQIVEAKLGMNSQPSPSLTIPPLRITAKGVSPASAAVAEATRTPRRNDNDTIPLNKKQAGVGDSSRKKGFADGANFLSGVNEEGDEEGDLSVFSSPRSMNGVNVRGRQSPRGEPSPSGRKRGDTSVSSERKRRRM